MLKIFAKYGISGKFKISKKTFPRYIEAMIPQKISGRSVIKSGPGCTPSTRNAPNMTAVVPEPGIPKLKSGTNAPLVAALLELSGAASPLMDPFPNSSGFLAIRFSKI